VDGRDKPGHDEKANHFHAVRKSLKILAAFFSQALRRPWCFKRLRSFWL
jgi:hypothetical protein